MTELNRFISGDAFTASYVSPAVRVTAGATGTYATLTPPTGERVLLTGLASFAARQNNLTTVTVGGNDKVSLVNLEDNSSIVAANAAGEFKLGYGSPNQSPFIGLVNEVLEIKTDIATTQDTTYTYQFGV